MIIHMHFVLTWIDMIVTFNADAAYPTLLALNIEDGIVPLGMPIDGTGTSAILVPVKLLYLHSTALIYLYAY